MKIRDVISLLSFALVFVAISASADDEKAPTSAKQFEALKSLAGDWVEVGKDGKPTDKLVTSIRVTAAGSAIQETIFPGTDHEMVTMYHLDGPDLVLTHYCMLGNQPRMRAEAAKDVNKIYFKFVGASNLKSEAEQHMNKATFTITSKDRYKTEWAACQDGKTCHEVTFELARKAK
jgi:hypothetical protein